MAEALDDDALLELAGGFGRLSPVVFFFMGANLLRRGPRVPFLIRAAACHR